MMVSLTTKGIWRHCLEINTGGFSCSGFTLKGSQVSKRSNYIMPHTKLIFAVQVNGEDYVKKQVYTAPSVPEALFNRVVNEYLMDDFGVLPDECTIDRSYQPFVVNINKEYTGPLDEFLALEETVVIKKRKRVIYDTDSEDDVSTTGSTSAAIVISDSEDSDDDSVIELSSDEDPEPPVKRRKVDNPGVSTYKYTHKYAVCRAMEFYNRPVTCMEIYKYFVNHDLLQIYEKDQKPTSYVPERFVTQRSTPSHYRARMACSLWELNKDGIVAISKIGGRRNVYSLI